MNARELHKQYRKYKGTGGTSQGNGRMGFLPAYLDSNTGQICLSRYRDGRLAPVHVLDGLPAQWVSLRSTSGRVLAILDSIVAGFERQGEFYTRDEAAALTSHRSEQKDIHDAA